MLLEVQSVAVRVW